MRERERGKEREGETNNCASLIDHNAVYVQMHVCLYHFIIQIGKQIIFVANRFILSLYIDDSVVFPINFRIFLFNFRCP